MVRIEPGSPSNASPYAIPAFLAPMIDSIKDGTSLMTVVQSIVRQLGFESFVYGMSLAKTHRRDEKFYVWATVPRQWLEEYDQKSYIEIDPRIKYGWDVLPPPLIWDSSIGAGDPRVEKFLARAACYGIGSGIAVYLRDNTGKVMVALSSSERHLTDQRRAEICTATGTIMHFASLFHWLFAKEVIARGLPPAQEGRPLSPRELSCLQFAAHGMTSKDIGVKLGITQRTANFHFANLISKMGVLNRHEAIATALMHDLITVSDTPCELPGRTGSRRRRR